MNTDNNKSELDTINTYQNKGYTDNFILIDGKLQETETKTNFTPEQVFIVAEHRFEGMTNPDDMSILYVIEAIGGYKGTLLVAYGPTSNSASAEFFNKVPKSHFEQKEVLN